MISIALGERVVRLVVENLSGGIVIGISYTYFFCVGYIRDDELSRGKKCETLHELKQKPSGYFTHPNCLSLSLALNYCTAL